MYEFGETIGGLERCYYFGHGKDLYHFDHFMGEHYFLVGWPVMSDSCCCLQYAEHTPPCGFGLTGHGMKASCQFIIHPMQDVPVTHYPANCLHAGKGFCMVCGCTGVIVHFLTS